MTEGDQRVFNQRFADTLFAFVDLQISTWCKAMFPTPRPLVLLGDPLVTPVPINHQRPIGEALQVAWSTNLTWEGRHFRLGALFAHD